MRRLFHWILCLIIFGLTVSASGIAASQTLAAYQPLDEPLTHPSPLKAPHAERLQAAYSVAVRPKAGLIRQIGAPATSQCCLKVLRFTQAQKTAARFFPVRFPFTQHYPQTQSPPPRHSAAI